MAKTRYLIVSGAMLLLLAGAAAYDNRQVLETNGPGLRGGIHPAETIELGKPARHHSLVPSAIEAKVRGAYSISENDHVETPSGSAMKAIEALLPSARSGDAKAALAIYSKLFSCRPEVDDSVIRSGIRAGEDDQQIAGHLANHREECAGTADLLLERGRWLEAAAASGLPEAQLLYATDMEAIVGTREQIIRNPEKLMRYKARSSGYLKELAATGNVDAMLALSSVYEHGTLVEQDPVRSYAYGRAAQLAIPSVIPHNMLDRQRATLSPEHIAEGERLGRIIHSTCCNSPRKEP